MNPSVLDITHPYFVSCTDEKILQKLLPYVERNSEKNAEKFNKIPSFIKRFLACDSPANDLIRFCSVSVPFNDFDIVMILNEQTGSYFKFQDLYHEL